MYDLNHPERIQLNNQIKEWNSNRLDLFQISEPNEDLDFYGVMRYFYQGDDLKYQTKCLRVSSTATTLDVVKALIVKFHPDSKTINNDKYVLYENHNLEDRRMKNSEHPLIVQLNWASDDKDGKFILKNESRRRRSTDMTNHSILSNYGMSRSTSTLTNGLDNQALRTQSSAIYSSNSNFFSRRFSNSKKNKIKTKADRVTFQDAADAKRLAEEMSGKPPESSFTRTISNPDDVMKRRRQKKLEFRLEQFSSVTGDGETGGTLKIYGDSINPDIPYKTLLLSVNDTTEKVLLETLDKYGIPPEDQRFYVLVQQNIPPRENRHRVNVEEIILHSQDCPLGILVHCPPEQGSANFAIRRVMKTDKFPSKARMPPFAVSKDSSLTPPINQTNSRNSNQLKLSSLSISTNDYSETIIDFPRLKKLIVDENGMWFDDEDGIFSLTSLINRQPKDMVPTEGSKLIKIGSQLSSVGGYPNILLLLEEHDDIRPVHCQISVKLDPQTNYMKFQVTPTLDSSSRTPRPCVIFVNQQRIDRSTKISNGDIIQLGESIMFRFEEFDEETVSTSQTRTMDDANQETFENLSDSMNISYYTSELPITVKYKPRRSQKLVEKIMKFSKQYANEGSKELFGGSNPTDVNIMNEAFRLGPAYTMYLVMRAALANEQQIVQLIDLIADHFDRAINEDRNSVEKDIFWLSNASELLHLLQYDNDLRNYSGTAQDVLASAIDHTFTIVQEQFSKDLMILLPALLSEDDLDIDDNTQEDNIPCLDRASVLNQQGGIDYPIQHLLQTLSLAFTLFHNCQVNVALTIQIFSQLFHLLNTWLFNNVLGEQTNIDGNNSEYAVTVSQEWGNRLTRRLNRIRYWSEINGLEMAANCHLQKMFQVAELMKADKRDLSIFGEKCIEMVNLNGAQLHHLLINCQDYDLPDPWIEVVVNTAIQLHEQDFNNKLDSNIVHKSQSALPLYEDLELRLPLLLPADGYCCDRGIVSCPSDLDLMLQSTKQFMKYRLNPPVIDEMDSRWKSYLGTCENTPTVSRSNTIEQSPTNPLKSDGLSLPRNWVSNSVHSDDISSSSNTLSSPHDKYQKTASITSQSSSSYSVSPVRHSLPIIDKHIKTPLNGLVKPPISKSLVEIKLKKMDNSLGLSIIAAKATSNDIFRIYVKDVIMGGAGHNCGKILPGDQLVSIDGNLLDDMNQDEAVIFMKKTKSEVTLLIDKGAAQRHGVMEAIIQARNSKNSSASQKSAQRIPNTNAPPMKKPLTTLISLPKIHSSKDEPLKLAMPPPPPLPTQTTKAQIKPHQATANNGKPSPRKVSDQNTVMEPDYSSLPVRNHKSNQLPGPEGHIYGTITKGPMPRVKFEADYRSLPSQPHETKTSISNSQPNLINSMKRSKIPQHSSSSGSLSSGSLSSSEDEESLTSLPKLTPQNTDKRNSSPIYEKLPPQSEQKQLSNTSTKSLPDMNIKSGQLGIPRHEIVTSEPEPQSTVLKRQVFSRPVITNNCDPVLSTEDESEPISLNKPVSLCESTSDSESETLSSHTESSSSSDSSPQPQQKLSTEPIHSQVVVVTPEEFVSPSTTNEPISETKPTESDVVVHEQSLSASIIDGPLPETEVVDSIAIKHNEFISQPQSKEPSIEQTSSPINVIKNEEIVPSSKRNAPSPAKKPLTGIKNLGGFKPIRLTNPKSDDQYSHLPDKESLNSLKNDSDISDGFVNVKKNERIEIKLEHPKAPTEEDIQFRRKAIAESIRQQTEEKERKSQTVEDSPIMLPAHTNDNKRISTKYGRPQFNTLSNEVTRPITLFTTEPNTVSNSSDTDFHFPSPPSSLIHTGTIVPEISPSSINHRKHIINIPTGPENHLPSSTAIDRNQDRVEELSFREKMKLFAAKMGNDDGTGFIERKKISSKQQKIEAGDYS